MTRSLGIKCSIGLSYGRSRQGFANSFPNLAGTATYYSVLLTHLLKPLLSTITGWGFFLSAYLIAPH